MRNITTNLNPTCHRKKFEMNLFNSYFARLLVNGSARLNLLGTYLRLNFPSKSHSCTKNNLTLICLDLQVSIGEHDSLKLFRDIVVGNGISKY